MNYYSAVMICVMLSLILLCVLVHENERLGKRDKAIYYLTYALIGVSALSEWISIFISGNIEINSIFLRITKCCDYVFTPMSGVAIVMQMRSRNVITKILYGVIGFNTLFQLTSFFTGWMTVIRSDNTYSHGSLYGLYMAMYLVIVFLVIIQFGIYGRHFRKQNRLSLYLILLLILIGIALQEVFGGGIRTSYMALTLGAAFLFIHTTELSQQKSDERIEQQKVLITTDALTGLMSRYAYSMALNNFNNEMPKDMVAFSIDINGLKEVNDNLGHDAGDELIQGASSCIEKFFPGCAYRTGGDEFVVLSRMNRKQAETITESLNKCVKAWHGNKVESMHLAIGFALAEENKDANCEELVIIADKMMYEAKSRYYKESGIDRRRR